MPVADMDTACRGDDPLDDDASYKEVSAVASLGECKELCRRHGACRGQRHQFQFDHVMKYGK